MTLAYYCFSQKSSKIVALFKGSDMRLTQQRIAEIMNKGRFGDRLSKRVDLALSLLILANLIAVCLESVDSIAAGYGPQLFAFEMISVTVFAAEYALRLWSAPMGPS